MYPSLPIQTVKHVSNKIRNDVVQNVKHKFTNNFVKMPKNLSKVSSYLPVYLEQDISQAIDNDWKTVTENPYASSMPHIESEKYVNNVKAHLDMRIQELHDIIAIENDAKIPKNAIILPTPLAGSIFVDESKKLVEWAKLYNKPCAICFNGKYAIAYPTDTSWIDVDVRRDNAYDIKSPAQIEASELEWLLYEIDVCMSILHGMNSLYLPPIFDKLHPYEYIIKIGKIKSYNIRALALEYIYTIPDSIMYLYTDMYTVDVNYIYSNKKWRDNALEQMTYFSEKDGSKVEEIMWEHVIKYCKSIS